MRAEDVDECMKLEWSLMGPLALLDFVGLDVAIAIGESIGADVGRDARAGGRRPARQEVGRRLLRVRLGDAALRGHERHEEHEDAEQDGREATLSGRCLIPASRFDWGACRAQGAP